LILTWCWCFNNTAVSAAASAKCSEKAALGHYSQCRRVCYSALDDREGCPEARPMGGPGHLVQIDECSVKAKRKRAANGRGRLGPGDRQEAHRGNAAEQAAIEGGVAEDDGGEEDEDDEVEDDGEEDDGGEEDEERAQRPAGWVFGIAWYRDQDEKRQGIPQETRFFAVHVIF
jgi:hypothetical protein